MIHTMRNFLKSNMARIRMIHAVDRDAYPTLESVCNDAVSRGLTELENSMGMTPRKKASL